MRRVNLVLTDVAAARLKHLKGVLDATSDSETIRRLIQLADVLFSECMDEQSHSISLTNRDGKQVIYSA